MAKFNIFLGNLNGGPLASVHEHALWIEHGLRDAGHDVLRDPTNLHPDRENIMFEWFVPGGPGSIQRKFMEFMTGPVRKLKYPYTIVVTEKCNGGSFNQSDSGHFGTQARWQGFTKVAGRAKRLWTLVPGDDVKLSFVNPNSSFLEFGWCKALEDFGAEHTVDFALYGSGTKDRNELVERLRAKGFSVNYPGRILPFAEKEAGQRAARVVLSPRIWGWFPIPSGTRPARVMHTDSACAVSWCPIVPRPQCYAHNQPDENGDFVEFAAGILSNYRALAKQSTERYRSEMPHIGECLTRCLDGGVSSRVS